MEPFVFTEPGSAGCRYFRSLVGEIPVNTIAGQCREKQKACEMCWRETKRKEMGAISSHGHGAERYENVAENNKIKKLSIVRCAQ